MLEGVRVGYKRLQKSTGGYKGLQKVTWSYREFKKVTEGSCGDKRL